MKHVPKDSRGTEIAVGARVAYNRSGDVIEGEVVDISPSGQFRIAPSADFRQNPSRQPSRVNRGRSILVLN